MHLLKPGQNILMLIPDLLKNAFGDTLPWFLFGKNSSALCPSLLGLWLSPFTFNSINRIPFHLHSPGFLFSSVTLSVKCVLYFHTFFNIHLCLLSPYHFSVVKLKLDGIVIFLILSLVVMRFAERSLPSIEGLL